MIVLLKGKALSTSLWCHLHAVDKTVVILRAETEKGRGDCHTVPIQARVSCSFTGLGHPLFTLLRQTHIILQEVAPTLSSSLCKDRWSAPPPRLPCKGLKVPVYIPVGLTFHKLFEGKIHVQFGFYFYIITALLRHNSCAIRVALIKCTILWLLATMNLWFLSMGLPVLDISCK